MAKRSKKQKRAPETGEVKPAEAEEIASAQSATVPWPTIFQALVIATAVLWIYCPVLHGDWLWDDNDAITENAITQNPTGLWSIWFDPASQLDYYPIKFSVQWLQWQLWGMDTFGYHLTNVVLHLVGALLVWRLLNKFHLRLAWLGGLIFAIHPVQVESVAWIVELKNTLSLPPLLLAMCAWIDYDERGKKGDYFLALGLFLVAMLCKSTMVMFPTVILLYAWWKRRRIGLKDLSASTPFFLVSATLGLATVWHQYHVAMHQSVVPMGGIFPRLARAGLSLSFYFSKCFLPVELMPLYPRWVVDPPTPAQFLPWPLFGGSIYWLWTKRRGWGRHALLGSGFFMLFLAPFLGFNAASYMAYTWVMDHFLYLPIIGLIGLLVAAFEQMDLKLPDSTHPFAIGLITVVLAFLAFESRGYGKIFINSETLWTYDVAHNPQSYFAHNNLALAIVRKGRLSQGIAQYDQALQINPDAAEVHNNLGDALQQSGRVAEAMEQFQQALRIYPDYDLAHYNLGLAFLKTGQISQALDQFDQTLQINPYDAEAHNNIGTILFQTGRFAQATEQFEQALQIKPTDAEAHYNLGDALEQTGRQPEAMEQFAAAVRLKPDYAKARNNLALALLQGGRVPEAIEQYQQALRLNPDFAEAHNNLGYALQQSGRIAEAIDQYEQALRIKPDYAEARDNLTRLQAFRTIPQAKN